VVDPVVVPVEAEAVSIGVGVSEGRHPERMKFITSKMLRFFFPKLFISMALDLLSFYRLGGCKFLKLLSQR
jgi:hypothetical protein